MASIVFLVSSARGVALADGSSKPAGVSVAEAYASYKKFRTAGFDVTVLTPDGMEPAPDPSGQAWWFHQPRQDLAYLAAVVRTFAAGRDQVRLTLSQTAELGLSGCRRVADRATAKGETVDRAFRTISEAAKSAWSDGRALVDTLSSSGSNRLSREEIEAAIASQRVDCDLLAKARAAELLTDPAFEHPASLAALTEGDLRGFDAVFVPGGLGALTDLAGSADVGRLVAAMHEKGGPVGTVGYGAAGLLAAPERPDGLWLFDGFQLTAVTEDEDMQARDGGPGTAWRLDAALLNAGAVFDDNAAAWEAHVVADRNLFTGQNTVSAEATADVIVERLGGGTAGRHLHAGDASVDDLRLPRAAQGETVEPADVAAGFLDAITAHDLETALGLVDENARVDVPGLRISDGDRGDLGDVLRDLLHGFPDLNLVIDRLIRTGPVVTVLVAAIGSQAATYRGVPTKGGSFALEQAWRFVVRDGLIVVVSAYWCQAQLYRRLGVRRYEEVAIA